MKAQSFIFPVAVLSAAVSFSVGLPAVAAAFITVGIVSVAFADYGRLARQPAYHLATRRESHPLAA